MSDQTSIKTDDDANLVAMSKDIVSAYVRNNSIAPEKVSELLGSIHDTLVEMAAVGSTERDDRRQPAVPVKQSIEAEHVVCLECGQRFKSLKRHLREQHHMTPAEYKDSWGLPSDYPMVPPSYSNVRSKIAKDNRLGKDLPNRRQNGGSSL